MNHSLDHYHATRSQITPSFTHNCFIIAHDRVILFLSLFIFLTNHESLCYNIPTLHHRPYLSFILLIRWFWVSIHPIFSWLVNCHVSWPLPLYRVDTIVWSAPQLCNLRTLLRPSQSSVLLRTSWSSILRAPSIRFTLLHSRLSLELSIALLGFAPSPGSTRNRLYCALHKVRGGYTTEARPLVHGSKEVVPVSRQGSIIFGCSCIALIESVVHPSVTESLGWEWPWQLSVTWLHRKLLFLANQVVSHWGQGGI